jgi:hypothetical protein
MWNQSMMVSNAEYGCPDSESQPPRVVNKAKGVKSEDERKERCKGNMNPSMPETAMRPQACSGFKLEAVKCIGISSVTRPVKVQYLPLT